VPRIATALYGTFCYAIFLGVFIYAIGFVADVGVPRGIDSAVRATPMQAVVIDLGLLTLFALQHSVMARPVFKRWWTRYVPPPVERSTYVLFASACLALLFWQWRSIDVIMWDVTLLPARIALTALSLTGWAIVLASTFMIDHFELFGVAQVLSKTRVKPGFRTVLLYRVVRHPLMLGFLIAFWATPTMTGGHLLFAAVTTAYILVALQLEERDLVDDLGDTYRHYRRRVPMLVPRLGQNAALNRNLFKRLPTSVTP
jgi:protein-S-isoprenylcysteine O-methyltransferase Ste14